MSRQTLCVSIGVSRYRDNFWLAPLRDAVHDAQWFSAFARNRGVIDANIRTLLNENADRESILSSLRRFPREVGARSFDFLVYFAGHGTCASEGGAVNIPLLLPFDASIVDPISSSISIRDILLALRSAGAESIFMFIDACSQDLTSFFTSQDLASLLSDIIDSDKGCFFVSLASHKLPVIEGGGTAGGLFTRTLLDAIEKVETNEHPTIADLSKEVASRAEEFCNPRVAAIGSLNAWLYQGPLKNDGGYSTDSGSRQKFYVRKALNASLLTRLRERREKPVFLYGPSGSGKTIALRQVLEQLPSAIYVSCDGSELTVSVLLERIVIAFHEQRPGIFISGLIRSTNKESLSRVADTGGACVLIDHAERINIDRIRTVSAELAIFSISILVATNRTPSPIDKEEWISVPLVERVEGKKWIKTLSSKEHISAEDAIRITKGNPSDFLMLLYGNGRSTELSGRTLDTSRVTTILQLTNGFGDLELFCSSFGLTFQERAFVGQTPYILPNGLWHCPNDQLLKAASVPDPDLICRSAKYLNDEIEDSSSTVDPAIQLLAIAVRYPEVALKLDGYFASAMRRLSSKGYSELILSTIDHMHGYVECLPITYSCVLEWVADRGLTALFAKLMNEAPRYLDDPRVLIIRARAAWWAGDYSTCIAIAQKVGDDKTIDKQINNAALLEIGIAHFFLGDWEDANTAFSALEGQEIFSFRTRHWARFMKATTRGLRGDDVEASIRQLNSSGEFLLDMGDFVGAAICFGNAAEISFKVGNLDRSEAFLAKGVKLAQSHGVAINEVEHERISLHVRLRRHGASSAAVAQIFDSLLLKLPRLDSRMEMMQVLNSLATAAILRDMLDEATTLIEQNEKLVLGNKEYEIYWRWNRALHAAKRNQTDLAKIEFFQGLALAKASSNNLALVQFLDDVQLLDEPSRDLFEFTRNSLNI